MPSSEWLGRDIGPRFRKWQRTSVRHLGRRDFEDLVREAIEDLPEEFLARLENVDVVVQAEPTRDQLWRHGIDEEGSLLGLYEGVPLTARENYGFVLPDKITIFQRPIEEICDSRDELVDEVQATVVHEVAHHFGIDDEALREMGL